MQRCAIVVSFQHVQRLRIGSDHGNRLHRALQRKDIAVILQQNDRFMRRLQRKLGVRRRSVLARSNLRISIRSRRIKQSKLEASRKQPRHRLVDRRFIDQPLMYGIYQCGIFVAAAKIIARFHRNGGRMRRIGRKVVAVLAVEIVDRPAVGNDITIEFPGLPQRLVQQIVVRASRRSIHAVVRAHNGVGLCIHHRHTKRRQVRVFHIVRRRIDVRSMPRRFRPAVYGIVFRRGNCLKDFRIVALQPLDESNAHLPRQVGIFAIRLLSASPAWIAKDIDVRRPEVQSTIDAVISLRLRLVELRARFGGDRVANVVL